MPALLTPNPTHSRRQLPIHSRQHLRVREPWTRLYPRMIATRSALRLATRWGEEERRHPCPRRAPGSFPVATHFWLPSPLRPCTLPWSAGEAGGGRGVRIQTIGCRLVGWWVLPSWRSRRCCGVKARITSRHLPLGFNPTTNPTNPRHQTPLTRTETLLPDPRPQTLDPQPRMSVATHRTGANSRDHRLGIRVSVEALSAPGVGLALEPALHLTSELMVGH
jgi:hypothetical protein